MAEPHRMTQEEQIGIECASRELGACRDLQGRFWVAWISHLEGADNVVARSWDQTGPGSTHPVSLAPGQYINPAAVATPEGPLFLWRSFAGGRWCVLTRRLRDGLWQEDITLCPDAGDVHGFAAAVEPTGSVLVAAVTAGEPEVRPYALRCARLREGGWETPVTVVESGDPLYRPSLAAAPDGTAWLAWDAYTEEHGYQVYACRRRNGAWERPQQVSRGEEWQLLPWLACDAAGRPYLAWLVSQRVRDEHGVVDHWPWLAFASYQSGVWEPMGDPRVMGPVPGVVESLAQGLLADRSYMGYYGRRRHPMLVAHQGGVWLLWERKLREDFDTANWGVLCARRYADRGWGAAVELHRGGVCYQVSPDATAEDGHIWIAYKGDPRKHSPVAHGDILASPVGLAEDEVHQSWLLETWHRWRPLPPREAVATEARPTVEHQGRRLQLFWGDLHCHSFQSPDAEGELDELLTYARDVAGLDFCALADNDWYPNNILTAGMWQEIQSVAARFTQAGRFLAFPGFEWTFHGPPTDRWNHRIVLYQGPGGQVFRRVEPSGRDVDSFVRSLCGTDALAHAHHKSWSVICEAFDRNVEVCSGWQVHTPDLSEVMVHLAAGHRIGFAGSSDGHRYVPGHGGGLVGVWAEELTPAAIFEALRARRNYATTGSRVAIRFGVSGFLMGEEGSLVEPAPISHGWGGWSNEAQSAQRPRVVVEVESPRDLVAVDIFRDGAPIHSAAANERRQLSLDWVDEHAAPGTHYYHLRVRLEGETPVLPHNSAPAEGNLAWSSPVWVRVG
ncbi:MAG: DUF3604 domain-containing protein [Anaerolineae bacterium]|nr:DUF3604 domain-containing protein [Anaerolineae bacterium]